MQIVGYETETAGENGGREPGLLLARDADDGSRPVERVTLTPGAKLDYPLGERRCAGSVEGEYHVPCDRPAAPYCEVHTETWVCARCTGTCLKEEMDCHEDHAVYLAAFAPDTFKVGVTRAWRLRTRLREQGADRAAHLRTVEDGRIARRIEADIAREVGDRVRVPTKVEGLDRAVDEAAWRELLAEFDPVKTYEFDYGLDLDRQPVAATLARGTVRGVAGRVLVLEQGATTYAVDLRDLVGYAVEESDGERRRQSSLGAFG